MTEPEDDVVVFQKQYVEALGGDVIAALMLSQIYYWYRPAKNGASKLRVYRNEKWWLAKSTMDWNQELGISPKQARRCMALLAEKGIIEVEVLRFDGTPTQHCRLASVDGRQVLNCPTQVFHLPAGAFPFALQGKSITETTAETTTKSKTATGVAYEQGYEMTDKTIAEILKEHQENKAKEPEGKATPSSMGILWKKRVTLLSSVGYAKPLTGKEVGQLKHVVKALGDTSLKVLDYALTNWQEFAWEVKAVKGLTSAPQEPAVGFFAMHYDVAVQLIAKPAPVAAVVKKAPVLVPKPVAKVADKVGAADIDATMALLDKLAN